MRLKPKNWDSFQHYKDRCPPWVKLHKSILDDRAFMSLPLASKALAPLMWLLASESKDGTFDGSVEELAFRLRITEKEIREGIKPLMDKGFFLDASAMLAPASEVHTFAVPETETETETETEKTLTENPSESGKPDPCPHQAIVDLYHEILPQLARVRDITEKRKTALRARWRQNQRFQNLDWWRKYFCAVAADDFLMGRIAGRNWQADFDFLLRPDKFQKIIEGGYQRGDQ